MKQNERIIILGGGLNGLTLAYLLSKKNIETIILEASSRLGGRIQSIQGKLNTPLELGATWFSEKHPNLISLIQELDLKKYPQFSKGLSLFQTKSFEPAQEFYVPDSEAPSYRIVGGTQMLTDTLSRKISSENIHLNTKVNAIKQAGNQLIIKADNGLEYYADKAVLCIPPQLVVSQIQISPALPEDVLRILPEVQTWMAGAIKFVLEYEEPFWRQNGYSGMLFSHSGIVTEMYDHTNFEQNKFGFTGFLNAGAVSYPREVRKELVLKQLKELLGEQALNPSTYVDKIWIDEFISDGNQIIHRPHQNNGHPLLQKSYMNGKIYFSGTETAPAFAGYMEGAVIAALNTADKLLK
ncbi:flavin monoamine oxidase family protein [Salegentibacter sediminis]|uniref:flavin monoamine oxidase family protein n=1 Tax=Salegentibacter sediminis TaxID=1930251 RepID=UPI0009BD4C0A|nr:NAD(P)/FAD-dependent oxidoreductase [Salegentibacter sediminis]